MDVSGPISLTLFKSLNGEFQEIANGVLDAIAQMFFGFHADRKRACLRATGRARRERFQARAQATGPRRARHEKRRYCAGYLRGSTVKPAAEKSERSRVNASSASSARMSANDVQSVKENVWSS
jgi:hypothetical protein